MKRIAFALALAGLCIACGGDDEGGGDAPDAMVQQPDAESAFECTDAASACATLTAPAGFTGTTRQLVVGMYTSLPPAGPPAEVSATIDNPVIAEGMDLEVEMTGLTSTGDVFFVPVLYMVGGGTFVPVPGVDYQGQTGAITLDGSAANLGTIELMLVQ